ncbi:MAG TPA: Hsp20/alpha crystallin family protein [Vicinamibacteria bacterium]|nr:Hsp20/alpha crystallin family protein [Vicinamibacteria bacterium]
MGPMSRWDGFRELEEMAEGLGELTGRGPIRAGDWSPAVDIEETDQEFLIKAELPEVKREDIEVSIQDGVLAIEGERKLEMEQKGRTFHRVERSYGRFVRSFALPEDADAAKVRADFKEGVLRVRVAKRAPTKAKSVQVKVA